MIEEDRQLAINDAYDEQAAERLLNLLAWVLRQSHRPRPLRDPGNWPPDLWVMDWPDTRAIALRDPVVYDLARHQAAADLRSEPERELSIFQEAELSHHIADLLEAAPPSDPPGAKQKGKRGIGLCVCKIASICKKSNPWGVKHYAGLNETHRFEPSTEAIAAEISDRLNLHPTLADYPEAVKSPHSLRAIIRGCISI